VSARAELETRERTLLVRSRWTSEIRRYFARSRYHHPWPATLASCQASLSADTIVGEDFLSRVDHLFAWKHSASPSRWSNSTRRLVLQIAQHGDRCSSCVPRKEMVDATEEILTDNGVRARARLT